MMVFAFKCSFLIIELNIAKLTIPRQNERILTGQTLLSKYLTQRSVAIIKK